MSAIIWLRPFYEQYCPDRKIVGLLPVSDDMYAHFLKDHGNVVKFHSWRPASY